VKIDIATLFPGMFREVLGTSILKLARERGVIDVALYDIRDFTFDRHRTVDDRPYGGGPGMLLAPEPVVLCVERILRERGPGRVVLLTPQGRKFTQAAARQYAADGHVVLVCGRYEGMDERIRTILSAEELSIGDYVLTGGELAAMVVTDAIARLVPGALGDGSSAASESFSDGTLGDGRALEGPQYTRPPEFRGLRVPEVLLSGDHARIARWREAESRKKTESLRGGDAADDTDEGWKP
jgi:tRNA (guanine37-N1)-methyltransferase